MSNLGASELLQVWERGQGGTAPERALLLLSAAWPEASPATLGELAVGERDGRLLALRERLFGRDMVCVTPCPGCGEQLELPADTRQFTTSGITVREFGLEREGFRVRFRIPTGADLVACSSEPDVAAAERQLLRRCLLDTRRGEQPVELEALPPALLEAMTQGLEAADPGADLRVESTCPVCEHHWESTFDIVSFLWIELQDWAIRVLREVHVLATAYGWAEEDILQLSPWRRRLYLQLVGS